MSNLIDIVGIDKSAFPCADGFDPCAFKERTISYALFVDVPQQPITPDEIFKECCYNHIVLASSTSFDNHKNDFSGFYHKRQLSNETVEFVLIEMKGDNEFVLNDDTYGEFKDFNSISEQRDLSTFILSWKKVLQDLGEGPYKVVKRIVVAGIPAEIEYLVYNLYEFSSGNANNTVRIDVSMTGLLEKQGVDFSSSDFKTSLRVPGFFGRREPSWEEDNIVNRAYVKRQVSMKQTNNYKFQTNMIPVCLTDEIFDFLLFSDDIRMNDYNLNNHSYGFLNFRVSLENNEGNRYISQSRKVELNLLFSDKVVNNNKRNY